MNNCLRHFLFSNSLKTIVSNQRKVNLNQFRYGSNVAELFKSSSLVKPDGSAGSGSELLNDKITALYFSASWCGPCKQFTPLLKNFYDNVNKDKKELEVIFVSLDRDEDSMKKYYKEYMGNWLRTEYDSDLISGLTEECSVSSIPSLKIVKNNGDVLNIQAREEVVMNGGDDSEGLLLRWKKVTN